MTLPGLKELSRRTSASLGENENTVDLTRRPSLHSTPSKEQLFEILKSRVTTVPPATLETGTTTSRPLSPSRDLPMTTQVESLLVDVLSRQNELLQAVSVNPPHPSKDEGKRDVATFTLVSSCDGCTGLESRLERVQGRLDEYKTRLERENQDLVVKWRQDVDALRQDVDDKNRVLKSAVQAVEGVEGELEKQRGENRVLARALERKDVEIQRLKAAVARERRERRKLDFMIDDWERCMKEMGCDTGDGVVSRYLEKLKSEIVSLSRRIVQQVKECKQVEEAKNVLDKQLDQRDTQVRVLKDKIYDSEIVCEQLRRERDSASSDARDSSMALKQHTEEAKQKYSSLERDLKSTIETSNLTIQRLRTEEDTNLSRCQRRAEELLSENAELAISLSEAKRRKGLFEYGLDGHMLDRSD